MKYALLFLSFTILACNSSSTTSTVNSGLSQLADAVKDNPSEQTMKAYFDAASKYIQENRSNAAAIKDVLTQGSTLAYQNSDFKNAASYLVPLIKLNCRDDANQQNIERLALSMNKMGKNTAARVLYQGYKKKYSSAANIPELNSLLTQDSYELSEYLDTLQQKMFENPDQTGLNVPNARRFVDVAEAFALVDCDNPEAANQLYTASETARSIRDFGKSLNIYDWFLDQYPSHEKTPTVVFLKGFILDNELKNYDLAREMYQTFLNNYPDHALAQSAKFQIENLGKSSDELLKLIEERRAEKEGNLSQ